MYAGAGIISGESNKQLLKCLKKGHGGINRDHLENVKPLENIHLRILILPNHKKHLEICVQVSQMFSAVVN